MKVCTKCNKSYKKAMFSRNNKICVCCNHCAKDMQKWYVKNRQTWIAKVCAYSRKNWPQKIVANSRVSDTNKKYSWDKSEYVTAKFPLNQYQLQEGICYWCGTEMQMRNRQLDNGLTIERLDNSLPHTRNNCVLACYQCNCKKWYIEKEPFLLC